MPVCVPRHIPTSAIRNPPSALLAQRRNRAERGTRLPPASDLRLTDASAIEFPDLGRMRDRRCRPAETFNPAGMLSA
jgi:hypothetical protein